MVSLTGTLLAGFELEREFDRDPMGRRYRAHQRGRVYMVRVLESWLTTHTQNLDALQRDFERARPLDDHFVPAAELVDAGDHWLVVTPWVEGPSLRDILDAQGPLPTHVVVPIFRLLLTALDRLHSQGVMHGALTPSQVCVGRLASGPRTLRLRDVGLWRLWNDGQRSPLTDRADLFSHHAAYMAPEQIEGLPTESPSDVYSAAILCYELLIGHPPFLSDLPSSTLKRQLIESPLALNLARPSLVPPRGLQGLLDQALDKNVEARLASPRAVLHALARVRPPTPSEDAGLLPEHVLAPPPLTSPSFGVETAEETMSTPPKDPTPPKQDDAPDVDATADSSAAPSDGDDAVTRGPKVSLPHIDIDEDSTTINGWFSDSADDKRISLDAIAAVGQEEDKAGQKRWLLGVLAGVVVLTIIIVTQINFAPDPPATTPEQDEAAARQRQLQEKLKGELEVAQRRFDRQLADGHLIGQNSAKELLEVTMPKFVAAELLNADQMADLKQRYIQRAITLTTEGVKELKDRFGSATLLGNERYAQMFKEHRDVAEIIAVDPTPVLRSANRVVVLALQGLWLSHALGAEARFAYAERRKAVHNRLARNTSMMAAVVNFSTDPKLIETYKAQRDSLEQRRISLQQMRPVTTVTWTPIAFPSDTPIDDIAPGDDDGPPVSEGTDADFGTSDATPKEEDTPDE